MIIDWSFPKYNLNLKVTQNSSDIQGPNCKVVPDVAKEMRWCPTLKCEGLNDHRSTKLQKANTLDMRCVWEHVNWL